MASITPLPTSSHPSQAIRPINLGRDVPAVMRLLNTVFSPTLDAEGRRALNSMNSTPAFLMRLHSFSSKTAAGFVFEADDKLVGNVSIIPTKIHGRTIIANVAVLDEYRRRGIARQMMDAALDHLYNRGIGTVLLQVDVHNEGAIKLYETLGFKTMGSTTYWLAGQSQIRSLSNPSAVDIRQLRSQDGAAAYELDRRVYPLDLNWPDPIRPNVYKPSMWQLLDGFINGRQSESWAIHDDKKLVAVGSIRSEWGRPHKLSLRIDPNERGRLTLPMLSKLLRRATYLRRRSISVEHPMNDALVHEYLLAANFRAKRQLATMKLVF